LRLPKVWLHVALSFLSMAAAAVAKVSVGKLDELRVCTLKVA
jgi:hypothetical protein